MAPKDKRKRRSTWTPPRTAGPAQRADGGSAEAQAARQARREDAKRQRERLRKQAVRRRRLRRLVWGLVVIGIAVGIVGVVIVSRPEPTATAQERQAELDKVASAIGEAGCDAEVADVEEFLGEDGVHTDSLPPLDQYPSQPPASGPHFAVTQSAGFYDAPPEIGRVLHSMEHAAAVVWYAPDIDDQALEDLRYHLDGLEKVIIAPYDYEGDGGQLPQGTEMALMGWHKMRFCDDANAPVALDFARDYAKGAFPAVQYRGVAPEEDSAI
jgi:hypothetical protein